MSKFAHAAGPNGGLVHVRQIFNRFVKESSSPKAATTLLETNLIELSSSVSDTAPSSGGAGLPAWFKSAVMGAAAYTQTQRMSCQGNQLREGEILAVQEFVSCVEVSFFF